MTSIVSDSSSQLNNMLSTHKNVFEDYESKLNLVSKDIKDLEKYLKDKKININYEVLINDKFESELLDTSRKRYYLGWGKINEAFRFYCKTVNFDSATYEDCLREYHEIGVVPPHDLFDELCEVQDVRPLIECPIELRLGVHPFLGKFIEGFSKKLSSGHLLSIDNKFFNFEAARKVDEILKSTEKELNERMLLIEKEIEFNDTHPEFGSGDEGNPKFQLVPTDWWKDRPYGKTWKVTRSYETLSFRKSNNGHKLYYLASTQEISLGVEELEGTSWYYCIDKQVYDTEDTPVTDAAVAVKVKCLKELDRLVELITEEVEDLPF